MKGFRFLAGPWLAATLGAGCGDATPASSGLPASPVGTYQEEVYRRGFSTQAGGLPVPTFEWVRTVTIRIAGDHSITYEWTSGHEPSSLPGRLEGTWREATAEERAALRLPFPRWWVFEPRGVGSKRGPDDPVRTVMWTASEWYVPEVDVVTGRLTDAYWGLQRTND
ncbi:MAG: hypothetical protein U1E39_06500 [Planctomycetota bacterium]